MDKVNYFEFTENNFSAVTRKSSSDFTDTSVHQLVLEEE